MQPKVSIIIPIYNVEKYLALCLNSVINQTLEDIEIICVEDGSTDNSKKILAEYEKAESRIRVIWHSDNMGTGMARKHGVLAAQGQYIMFLDSDDELFPQACEVAYAAILKNKTDVVQFGVKVVNKEGKTMQFEHLCIDESGRLEDYNLLCLRQKGKLKSWEITNKIFRSELCKRACGDMMAAHLSMAEDVYLFCILGYYAKSVSMINEQLYLYRWGVGVSTTLHTVQFVSLENFKKLLGEKDSLDAISRFINNKPDKERYKSFIQTLHDDWLHLAVFLWQGKLAEEDQEEGFSVLIRKWGLEETAKGLRWLMSTQQNNAQKEKGRLETELEQTKNDLAVSKQSVLEAELKIKAIETGLSFRLGRAVTYIPRKLLGRP